MEYGRCTRLILAGRKETAWGRRRLMEAFLERMGVEFSFEGWDRVILVK